MPGTQGGPCMHTIAAKAIEFKHAQTPEFREYQKQVIKNAQALSGALHKRGYRIVSGTTYNHLFVIDLSDKTITGKDASHALEKAGITISKSTVPFDTQKPWVTSGIRIGTPAVTTRAMKEEEMQLIAQWIDHAITNHKNDQVLAAIKKEVESLCAQFPIYK